MIFNRIFFLCAKSFKKFISPIYTALQKGNLEKAKRQSLKPAFLLSTFSLEDYSIIADSVILEARPPRYSVKIPKLAETASMRIRNNPDFISQVACHSLLHFLSKGTGKANRITL